LEARTLVRRRPDPQDGRGVLVGLTTHGVRLVDTALEDLLERERGQLTELTDGQQELLKDLLRSMVAPFDAE
jgi:DNA-binding MarR family transcriptional regulator